MLEIDDVWTSCGCTVAHPERRTVEAGGEFVVRGEVDTASPGSRTSDVFVRSNAFGVPGAVVATIAYTVRFGWRPTQPIVLETPGDEPGASLAAFYLVNDDRVAPLDVRSVSIDGPGLTFAFTLDDRTLRVTAHADAGLAAGDYPCTLRVESDSENAPTARIAARVVHRPERFTTVPPALLAVVDPRHLDEVDVRASLFADGAPVRVTSARSLTEGTEVELRASETVGEFGLRCRAPTPSAESRRVRVLLESDAGPTLREVLLAVPATEPPRSPGK